MHELPQDLVSQRTLFALMSTIYIQLLSFIKREHETFLYFMDARIISVHFIKFFQRQILTEIMNQRHYNTEDEIDLSRRTNILQRKHYSWESRIYYSYIERPKIKIW